MFTNTSPQMNRVIMKLYSLDDVYSLEAPEVRKLYREHVNPGLEDILYSFAAGESLVQHAEGVWLHYPDGRRVLDVSGGIGVLTLGHNHPRILRARTEYQARKRMEVHKTIFCPEMAALSHNMAQLLPDDLNYPYFCNSGAEAVEGAMKMAYKYHDGNRGHILHADVSFHGKLLGSGGMTNILEDAFRFPTIPGIRSFELNNLESVERLVTDLRQTDGKSDVYAIICEPFNAITLTEATPEFLQGLRTLCDREKIVLIIDEVFCGWCKTGNLFRFMNSDIVPDILTTSKALGGGKASISSYIGRTAILKKAYGDTGTATLHSTTYNGFGEECATALEAINVIVEEDYVGKSRALEEQVAKRGAGLLAKYPDHIEQIRGAGALHGVFLTQKESRLQSLLAKLPVKMLKDRRFIAKLTVASVVDWLYKKHNIFTFFNNNRDVGVLFSPSLVINPSEVDQFFDAMDATLEHGLLKVTTEFVKSKIVKKIAG